MTVYVDDAGIEWHGHPRFHMSADTLDELHMFAVSIGVKRCWYHRGTRHPHFDITAAQREAALLVGARAVDQRTLLTIGKRPNPA